MKLRTKQKKSASVNQEQPGVRTINDLMMSVEQEIAELKAGNLSEPKARVIAKNRDIQLKAFELVLNAAKLESKLRPELTRRVALFSLQEENPKSILQ